MKREHQHHLQTLPDDVVFSHILPRLPVKSLLKFKCVSKNWHLFIKSPYFAKTHLEFSTTTPHFLLLNNSKEFYSLAYDKTHINELVLLDTNKEVDFNVLCIVGCCNGLVCLIGKVGKDLCFALWNPATHQIRKVEFPIGEILVGFGFGYSPAVNDHIIFAAFDGEVNSFLMLVKSNGWIKCDTCSSSSRSGSSSRRRGWDDCSKIDFREISYPVGVFLDDTLYWYDSCKKRILGFNLVSQEFKVISIMNWVNGYEAAELYAFEGCLALCCNKIDRARDVWIMEELGVSNSWKKVFSVPSMCRLLDISVTGKTLIETSGQLKLVDFSVQDVAHCCGIEVDGFIRGVHHYYVESLVSPFGIE